MEALSGSKEKKLAQIRPVLQAGDWVEWLSEALPRQQATVLAVHPDGTFEVFHPLALASRRLPIGWVTKVWKSPPEAHS